MQGKSETTNKAGTDRDNKKVSYLILSGGLLTVLLAGIISHVTANSMGDLSESRIRESHGQMETIVSKCMDTLQDLALATGASPAGLRPLVENHLRINPSKSDNREIFEWLKTRQMSMSDLRHDKIDALILEARKNYQVSLAELQDVRETYRKHIDSVYAGFWLSRNGYPRIESVDWSDQQ